LAGFLSAFLFASLLEAQDQYQKWLEEDVVYIITDADRQAFQHFTSDAERDRFIEQFWSRRNPAPTAAANPLKEEHYRRIAYANERFAATVPGWKSDRGHVYIVFGPPDEIESHRSGAGSDPHELWRYQHVEGRGAMAFDFVDPALTGEYKLAVEPEQRDALFRPGAEGTTVPPVGLQYREKGKSLSVSIDRSAQTKISVPIFAAVPAAVYGRITDGGNHAVYVFEETTRAPIYERLVTLPAGLYNLKIVRRDAAGNAIEYVLSFDVK
jgi:GWxTD domain-containing protein